MVFERIFPYPVIPERLTSDALVSGIRLWSWCAGGDVACCHGNSLAVSVCGLVVVNRNSSLINGLHGVIPTLRHELKIIKHAFYSTSIRWYLQAPRFFPFWLFKDHATLVLNPDVLCATQQNLHASVFYTITVHYDHDWRRKSTIKFIWLCVRNRLKLKSDDLHWSSLSIWTVLVWKKKFSNFAWKITLCRSLATNKWTLFFVSVGMKSLQLVNLNIVFTWTLNKEASASRCVNLQVISQQAVLFFIFDSDS